MHNSIRLRHWPHTSILAVAVIARVLASLCFPYTASAAVSSTAKFLVPYSNCQPDKKTNKGKIGAGVDAIEALCLKSTTSLTTTLDNANKLFIGNSSNIGSFGALCVPISAILRVSSDGNSLYPGDLPDYFASQTWSLPAWQPVDPSVSNQTVILQIVNNGASSLTLSGINFTTLGLPEDFSVEPGKKKKIRFDRNLVDLSYASLELLATYLSGENEPVINGDMTAVIIVQRFDNDPDGKLALASYVILSPQDDIEVPYLFHMYETVYYLPTAGSRRRLLAVPGQAKSPPTTCARACCKAINPPPSGCKPGTSKYPGCKTKCTCSC